MTINNNTNTYVNTNNVNSTLGKIATGLAINKAADDASGLAIADKLGVQKSGLSQAVENVNSGIAMSNIAQQGISSQKELLENIRTETMKASTATTSEEGRKAIAEQINKYITQYEQIADSTNYNGETLLKTAGDASDDLTIVGEGSDVTMGKADTTSISDQLRTLMSDFVTNENSRDDMLDVLDDGIDTLASQASEFGSTSNSLESMARNYMSAQTNIANAQSQIQDADLAEMFSQLNKDNLQIQTGFFAQSQANAVQGNVLSLLS